MRGLGTQLERYAAEALVHRMLPADAFAGIGVLGLERAVRLDKDVQSQSLKTKIVARPSWFLQ